MSSSLYIERLAQALCADPSQVAFIDEDGELTYGQLVARAASLAQALKAQGLEPGQRVAALLRPRAALVIALLAHHMARLIYVPVNPAYGQLELTHLLSDCDASALLLDEDAPDASDARWRSALEGRPVLSLDALLSASAPGALADSPASWPQDEDIALLIYTSGTTGASKGVMLSYRAIVAGIDALTTLWRWSPQDHLALTLPLFHIHGLGIGVYGSLLQSARATILPRFEPEAIGRLVARDATIFMGVPTMYVRLIQAMERDGALQAALRRARLFTCGSAALDASSAASFERLTGHRVLERYGMSETMLTLSNPYEPSLRRPGTLGLPIPGVQARVVDEDGSPLERPDELGHLQVRGPTLMSGYWGQPERTAQAYDADGWFKTGDLVRLDEQGYYVHQGRSSVDILKSGGYKLSAREIEEAILTHPDVQEVAVVGRPDAEWGQRVEAALVPRQGSPPRDEAAWLLALQEHLHERLARFKHPKQVRCLDALPRNALGKVQKHLL